MGSNNGRHRESTRGDSNEARQYREGETEKLRRRSDTERSKREERREEQLQNAYGRARKTGPPVRETNTNLSWFRGV